MTFRDADGVERNQAIALAIQGTQPWHGIFGADPTRGGDDAEPSIGNESFLTLRRIVFFTPGLSEPGGAQRRSRLYVEGFAERGWDVKVVTRSGTLKRFVTRKEPGLLVLEVPGFSSVLLGGFLFLAIAIPLGVIWGLRARCFLAVQFGSQSTAAGVCAAITRRPFFAFGSSTGQLSELRLVLDRRTGPFRRRLLGRAARLVAQTEDGAAEIKALLPKVRTEVVPTPVKLSAAPPLTGAPHALFAGRFSEEKDLGRLLDVWPEVITRHASAVLTLAGSGGAFRSVEAELRRRVVESSLESSVNFTGWVDDLAPLLASHDVFVFPSLSEGMSNSLLEAVAAKRVIVASDIPSNRAVLGDGYPLLFAAGDSTEMTRVLLRAFGDDATRSKALDHIDTRMSRFSADRIVDRVEGMVEDAYRTRHQHP